MKLLIKSVLIAASLLLTPSVAHSDGGCVSDLALRRSGANHSPVSRVQVLVCAYTNGTCASPATLYSDAALTQSVGNPVTADSEGNYSFCAAPGRYTVQVRSAVSGQVLGVNELTVQASADAAKGITDSGIKHQRVSTSSISANTRSEVTLKWESAFADANYTPVCMVIDGATAAGKQGLTLERIRTWNPSGVSVVINNPTAGAITGTVACYALHD